MRGPRSLRKLLLYFRSNPVSRIGAWVTTLSFLMMLTFTVFEATGTVTGPYAGLVLVVVLPGIFTVGLVLIPVGILIYRKKIEDRIAELERRPGNLLRAIGILTIANVVIVTVSGYHGYHYTDSVEFCGTLCHEVMQPYYEAYLDSPHARVACVECHIGSGASWFVKSKLSGARQVLAVLKDDFSRPVPTPVANLRPARDTCEQCHWPSQFHGDRVVVRRRHHYDRDSTPYFHVLALRTGGVKPDGSATGIHRHVHPNFEVMFRATDEARTQIPWVSLRNRETGESVVYTTPGTDPDRPPDGHERTMDCVDCHNAPSHRFLRSWESVDAAIAAGRIPHGLPFVKTVGREIVEREWSSAEEAEAGIHEALEETYAGEDSEDIAAAATALIAIWKRNVFPGMKIRWNSYPSFAGHYGCMRCHDDDHRSPDGRVISMDCETCHAVLAFRAKDASILQPGGDD